jgi:hypothetical protein
MLILFHVTLFLLLLFQYICIAALILNEDEMTSSKREVLLLMFPLVPVIFFTFYGLYALIFNNAVRDDFYKKLKKIK